MSRTSPERLMYVQFTSCVYWVKGDIDLKWSMKFYNFGKEEVPNKEKVNPNSPSSEPYLFKVFLP